MSIVQADVQKFLAARSLAPPERRLIKNANRDLIEHLRTDPALSIARAFIGGSYKKHTAITAHWDVDLVLFVNDELAEFADQYEHILQLVLNRLRTLDGFEILQEYPLVIKGFFKGVSYDILLGVNALKGASGFDLQLQYRTIVEAIADCPQEDAGRVYSASMTESSVEFIKDQPEQVRDGIKLAKIWAKETTFVLRERTGSRLTARFKSYAVELLCVHCYWAKRRGRKLTALDIFARFISLLANLTSSLPIEITVRGTLYSPSQWQAGRTRSSNPLTVWDPVNPTSDVVARFTEWASLKQAAERTLDVLSRGNASLDRVLTPRVIVPPATPYRAPMSSIRGVRVSRVRWYKTQIRGPVCARLDKGLQSPDAIEDVVFKCARPPCTTATHAHCRGARVVHPARESSICAGGQAALRGAGAARAPYVWHQEPPVECGRRRPGRQCQRDGYRRDCHSVWLLLPFGRCRDRMILCTRCTRSSARAQLWRSGL